MKIPLLAVALLGILLQSAAAEEVFVKYHGNVKLDRFDCEEIARSSFVNRICYDQRNSYMLIQLQRTYYHYCGIPAGVVRQLKAASSVGSYYNQQIKGSYDCRATAPPRY
jgi:hypothetical protein